MTDRIKVIVDENVYKVEDRERIQTCVFLAADGSEVLFQRDKNGKVKTVESPAEKFESLSWAIARGIAGQKLLNPFKKKEWKHTTKVLSSPGPAVAVLGCRYSEADARRHEQKLRTHTDDD